MILSGCCRNIAVTTNSGITGQITLSIIVTVTLFGLGYLFTYWRNRHNELKRLQDLRLYFYVALENLIAAIDNQYHYFRDFSLVLKKKETKSFFVLKSSIGFHLNNISFLNRNDIFKALVKEQDGDLKTKSKAFATLYDNLELLDSISKNKKDELTEFVDALNKYSFEFDESIDKIDKLFKTEVLTHIQQTNLDHITDPLLNRVDAIIADWQQSENFRDIYVKKKMLIEKLHLIVKEKKISKFRQELEKLVMSALLSFANFEVNRNRFLRVYKGHAINLVRAKAKIVNQLVLFNSLTPRKVLGIFPCETKDLDYYKMKWKTGVVQRKALDSNETSA